MSNKKVVINKKTNLLEEKTYNYNLQNVKEPQLYREIFDYDNVPKIVFNNRFVPQAMPENIWITDTTFRDGQQSTSPFTVQQIVDLFKLMSRLGGKTVLSVSRSFSCIPKRIGRLPALVWI